MYQTLHYAGEKPTSGGSSFPGNEGGLLGQGKPDDWDTDAFGADPFFRDLQVNLPKN
jgi:hypothetical protein